MKRGRGDVAILLQRDQQILIQSLDKVRQREASQSCYRGSSKFDSIDNGRNERVSDKSKSLETVCTEGRGTKIQYGTGSHYKISPKSAWGRSKNNVVENIGYTRIFEHAEHRLLRTRHPALKGGHFTLTYPAFWIWRDATSTPADTP